MVKLINIKRVGSKNAKKLQKIGIHTTKRLLLVAAHRQGRIDLARETRLTQKLILKWVNLADLIRIKGIGQHYIDLLDQAGVNSVKELAKRRPAQLYQEVVKLKLNNNLVRRLPAYKDIEHWIKNAKKLKPVIKK